MVLTDYKTCIAFNILIKHYKIKYTLLFLFWVIRYFTEIMSNFYATHCVHTSTYIYTIISRFIIADTNLIAN